ncbi:MAG: hypothetical protein GY869_19935, partial [Planctomycetes bacterium]|nr:hypothetical protein [Planctomycetota bacterium]
MKLFLFISAIFLLFMGTTQAQSNNYFKIKVIDQSTGRGVPMVELETLNSVRYVTDSNGLVAFFEPGLMDRPVYFRVLSAGYKFARPTDRFGHRGVTLQTVSGDSAVIELRRVNIAERLYRVTGAGIYRDSYLLGEPVPIRQPVINGLVLGQDSVLETIYRGKVFWIWGDTFKSDHPEGNFSISAATSELSGQGGLDPGYGVDLNYFVDSTGFSKPMIDIPGPGFVWFDWLLRLKDNGAEKLVAKYARVNELFGNYERGIAVFNDTTEMFERYKQVPAWLPEFHSTVHPFLADVNGDELFYFTVMFDFRRVKPRLDDLADPGAYESFTCLETAEIYDKDNPNLERDPDGKLIWGWKKNTGTIDLKRQNELIAAGHLQADEGWVQLRDIKTGELLEVGRGSIYWNQFRERWIMLAGKSVGEIWYAEGDTPVGPWVYARRVVKHDRFFYNPTQHPAFDQDGGRLIYFEGTYTIMFSGNPIKIPRYEYNQLMYRLALDDQRLFLPQPVYLVQMEDGRQEYQLWETVELENNRDMIREISFFA